MLTVDVIELQQRFPLGNSESVTTFAVLRLPNKVLVTVALDPEDVEKVLQANQDSGIPDDQGVSEEVPAFPQEEEGTFEPQPPSMSLLTQPEVDEESFEAFLQDEEQAAPQEEGEQDVAWADLPDEVLPSHMKEILVQVGAAPVMPYSALQNLVDEISERMAQQAEAQGVLSKPPAPPQQPQRQARPPVQPAVGQVHLQPVPRRRTVPMNDMGYPMVPGMEQDPGEISANSDEDGVSQL